MSEEEKQAIEKLDYELTYSWVHNQGISKETLKSFKDIIDKQQKEIKARLEEIDSLYKMISVKDDEIEKLKEEYQILKDDIEEHNIVYVDTPEFEENYVRKDNRHYKCKLEVCRYNFKTIHKWEE